MSRLRVRIELNRGGVGVPLHKLASVVDEAQKFFHMLASDVHIEKNKGEWLGFDFDHESLNFTAEYVGPVTPEQVRAFYAAFDGTTPLRRATIAQFARITENISEDELIGFGLYSSEEQVEPAEWRCLSRRDALRMTDAIHLLANAPTDPVSHLPAVSDQSVAARVFSDRRVRDSDASVAERLARVEQRVEQHHHLIHDLNTQSNAAEQSFRNLLSAVETFCDQAARQIEKVSPVASLPPAKEPAKPLWSKRWTLAGIAAAIALVIFLVGLRLWPARSAEPETPKIVAAAPPPPPAPEPAPVMRPQVTRPQPMRIEIESSEPTWISLTDADGNKLLTRVLTPGDVRTVELDRGATLRTGNAGGLAVRMNGKSLGPIGPHGKVREIQFKDGEFKIVAID